MILTVEKWLHLWEKVILPCDTCGTPTVHALNKTGDKYVCGCADEVTIEFVDEKETE